jgi:hypothetical protein
LKKAVSSGYSGHTVTVQTSSSPNISHSFAAHEQERNRSPKGNHCLLGKASERLTHLGPDGDHLAMNNHHLDLSAVNRAMGKRFPKPEQSVITVMVDGDAPTWYKHRITIEDTTLFSDQDVIRGIMAAKM